MTLANKFNQARRNATEKLLQAALPNTQLEDYDEENLEKLSTTGIGVELEIYKWSNGKNTLYLVHKNNIGTEYEATVLTLPYIRRRTRQHTSRRGTNRMTTLEEHFEAICDHVKTIEIEDRQSPPDVSVGDRVTVNRNLHNGQTTEIEVEAVGQQNNQLIIGGDKIQ